jgi:hypothetical protein
MGTNSKEIVGSNGLVRPTHREQQGRPISSPVSRELLRSPIALVVVEDLLHKWSSAFEGHSVIIWRLQRGHGHAPL